MPKGAPFKHGKSKCLFCNETASSRTHIWPEWLNTLLAPPTQFLVELEKPKHRGEPDERKARQGSMFSQKPYLTCVTCNTGWMEKFESDMRKFSQPLFLSPTTELKLNADQQCTMAGWIALITMLAERIDKSKSSIVIPQRDLDFLKANLKPPREWSIFAASLDGQRWKARYRHPTTFVGNFSSEAEFHAAVREGKKPNTQVSSFGIGSIFFQVFTCPDPRFVADYRRQAVVTKLSQIWPISPRILMFPRTPKFPTDPILSDEMADELADAYSERIKALTGPFSV